MTTPTMNRINQLSDERAKLYRAALNGRSGDPAIRQRILEMSRELDALWEQRRQERAGHREGIDLLIDRVYEQLYGARYDEAVAPIRVGSAEDETTTIAA